MTQAGPVHRSFPQIGQVFELTTEKEIVGLELVSRCGLDPNGWHFLGENIPSGTSRHFKLIKSSEQAPLHILADFVAQGGRRARGSWLDVLVKSFGPTPLIVGALDLSWARPDRSGGDFPIVQGSAGSFYYTHGCPAVDVWLVEVDEPSAD